MDSEVRVSRSNQYLHGATPVTIHMVYDENSHGDTLSTALHSHEFNELVVVFSGTAVHVTELGEYPVSAGDVFVVMAGEVHGYRHSKHLALANVIYLPEALGNDPADLRGLPGYHALFTLEPQYRHQHQLRSCLSLEAGMLAHARRLIGGMTDEIRDARQGFRYLTRAIFMELVTLLARAYGEQRRDTTRPILSLGAVLGHIERHFAEPVTLVDLAEMASMSESTFLRAFNKAVGMPPIEYVVRLRVAQAARLLEKTELRIGEIALRSGFSDSNYLARQFRRILGTSPSAWRCRSRNP